MNVHRLRLGLYAPWGLFLLFCAGWTSYWFVVRDTAHHALDRWSAALHGVGGEFTYASAKDSGFPLHLTLTLSDVRLKAPGGATTLATELLPVSVNLSNPRHVIVGLAKPVRMALDRKVYGLSARSGEMSVRTGESGALQRLSVVISHATFSDAGGRESTASQAAFHVRPDPRAAGSVQVVLELSGYEGAALPYLAKLCPCGTLRAAISGPAQSSLANARWRIERYEARTAAGSFSGDGRLSFDDTGRPAGDISVASGTTAPARLRAANGWWTLNGARLAPAGPFQLFPD